MSSIDPTPSIIATNALQGIPFSAIIGAPLQAAIEAQTMAANATANFINTVGLQTDPTTGLKTAVQVIFTYQQGSQTLNLIVPLLAILPIPYIAVSNITIDFTANINAASSSVAQQASESNTSATGSLGFSGWGVTANFSATYSSKQSSSASQSSKYSVEYTLTIHVEAEQDDMPKGLQTILNILGNAATTANPNGSIQVQVPPATPNNFTATVTGTVLNSNGAATANVPVTIQTVPGDPNPPTLTVSSATTDGNGQFAFGVTWGSVGTTQVALSATIPGAPAAAAATIGIPFAQPNPGTLSFQFLNTTSATQTITATLLDQNGNPVNGNAITFAPNPANTAITLNGSPATTANGGVATVTAAFAAPSGTTSSTTVPFTATGTALPGSSAPPSANFQLVFPAPTGT